jgi:dTDP-4-amino-4,6-dideoxygalactose transaminase
MPREFERSVSKEIRTAIEQLLTDGSWADYTGSNSAGLVDQLQATFARRFARLCCSGTLAVELALRGLQLSANDEILLAAYDFPGNFRACEAVGVQIALADVSPGHWTFQNVETLEHARRAQTRAVIVSHLHGELANMPAICEWAAMHDIAVLEDACQVPGASVSGRPAGSWGAVSTLSFGGSKLLTAGRGGAVLTDSPTISQRLKIYSDRGNDAFALSEIQAAVLLPQLAQLGQSTTTRQQLAQKLADQLSEWGLRIPIGSRSEPIESTENSSQSEDHCLPAYYKLGCFRGDSHPSADALVGKLSEIGIRIGRGFRGFYNRTGKRCRKVAEYPHAKYAADNTLLIDHTSLDWTESEIEAARLVFETNS